MVPAHPDRQCLENFYCPAGSALETRLLEKLIRSDKCDTPTMPSESDDLLPAYSHPAFSTHALECACDFGHKCGVGSTEKDGRTLLDAAAKPCPAGYFCRPTGEDPAKCPAGRYCVAGSKNTGGTAAAITIAQLPPCKAGYYCPAGSTDKTGKVETAAGTGTCSTTKGCECSEGYFCPEGSQKEQGFPLEKLVEQKFKEAELVYPGEGADGTAYSCAADRACPCPAGKFCKEGTAPSDVATNNCQQGFFCPATSTTAQGKPKAPKGKGARRCDAKQPCPCPVGHYCGARCVLSRARWRLGFLVARSA